MLLPRYRDYDVRLRLARIELGKDFDLVYPLENIQGYEVPAVVKTEYTEMEIATKARSPSEGLVDIIVERVAEVLNSNPLAWCASGAVVRLDRIANLFVITVRPYARPVEEPSVAV